MTAEEGKLDQMLWDIERDNVSGSVKMARKTATLLKEAAQVADATGRPMGEFVRTWGEAAAKAHPFMALVRTVGREAATADTADDLGYRMDRLLWDLDNSNARIAENMARLFPEGGTFMTNSFSATVYAALGSLVEGGRDVRAIVVESRPAREGVQLARALGELGIASTLIVDAGVASFVKRANAVLVGGDAVTGSVFVNKLGTLPMVLSARSYGVPVYLLASTNKLLPEEEVPETENNRAPEEVESSSMEGVTVENIYFERVPLELINGAVTEDGVLSPEEIATRVRALG
jgi:translation initiation factor eIF-2B subunit delta